MAQTTKQLKQARKAEKRRDKKVYGKGEAGRRAKMAAQAKEAAKKKAARAQERAISSVESTEGASMKKYGASAKKLKREVKKTKSTSETGKQTVKNVFKKGDTFASKQTKKTTRKGPNSAEEARLGVVKKKTKQTAKMSGGTGANEGGKYKSKTKFVKDGKKATSKVVEKKNKGVKTRKETVKSGGKKIKLKSMPMKEGPAKNPKKYGSSMAGEKYDAKEAYNKNLTASARLHYLENERHDKTSRPSIHKHMRNFGGSMKNHNMGAAMKGTPPGSRMQNLAKKAMNNRPAQYTDSGQNYRDANNRFISGSRVDEGELSPVIRKSPMRPYVKASKDSMYAGEKLFLTKEKGAMKRTGKPTRKK